MSSVPATQNRLTLGKSLPGVSHPQLLLCTRAQESGLGTTHRTEILPAQREGSKSVQPHGHSLGFAAASHAPGHSRLTVPCCRGAPKEPWSNPALCFALSPGVFFQCLLAKAGPEEHPHRMQHRSSCPHPPLVSSPKAKILCPPADPGKWDSWSFYSCAENSHKTKYVSVLSPRSWHHHCPDALAGTCPSSWLSWSPGPLLLTKWK